jgi:hypothetical protein
MSKLNDKLIRVLQDCIHSIKTYHSYDYCYTSECAACQTRKDAEEVIRELKKAKGEKPKK